MWCDVSGGVVGGEGLAEGMFYGYCCQVVAFEMAEELWGGEKTHLVLDADVLHLMCISSPNLAKWW